MFIYKSNIKTSLPLFSLFSRLMILITNSLSSLIDM